MIWEVESINGPISFNLQSNKTIFNGNFPQKSTSLAHNNLQPAITLYHIDFSQFPGLKSG